MRSITDPESEPEQTPQWWEFWSFGVCEVCGVREEATVSELHARYHISRGERP